MVVTITFNLPEEQEEYKTHIQANAMSIALLRFEQDVLRSYLKYGSTQHYPALNTASTPEEAVEAIRAAFNVILQDEGVVL